MKKYLIRCKKEYIKFTEYKNRTIMDGKEGNNFIAKNIEKGEPFFVTRIGATELEILGYYLYKNRQFDEYIKGKAHKHAGIFPENDEGLNSFSKEYLDGIRVADCIGVWFNKNEGKIINTLNKECKLTELRALEPYYWTEPWSKYLSGKKVLVIHPFKESIEKQYKIKEKLFGSNEILGDFDLEVIKAIQSMKGSKCEFPTWIDALKFMKEEIYKHDFDIALIGAGGYGLPLGAYIKSIGKQAIHIGGATQILFGIKGSRWDKHEFISQLYNENWIRPSENEIYIGAEKVEGGCYW